MIPLPSPWGSWWDHDRGCIRTRVRVAGSARPATKAPVRSEARKPGTRSDNASTEQPGRTRPSDQPWNQRGVNGRSEATEPGTRSDRVPMEPLRSHSPGPPHRQRRSSWSERSDVTGNEERSRANRKEPEGAALEDEARWPRPWAAPQGKIYTR